MALPVSGAISFNDINVELAVSGTTEASLGQATYRALAGVASGAISMSDFYGKSSQFTFTISSNTANANLRTLAISAGWDQSSALQATINSGVYVYSTSTGTPALTVNGSFPGGVSLIINGTIQGCGGGGGGGGGIISGSYGSIPTAGGSGGGGGLALSVSSAISITNNNRIAGGGGGGGGGGAAIASSGYGTYYLYGGGGGSGLGNGSFTSPGAGGSGTYGYGYGYGGTGGSGGTYGSGGSNGGGGYSQNGPSSSGGGGGGGGGAVSGNSNITWVATGTRNGGIS